MVRWTESVTWLASEGGVTHMLELGTGKVLTGLARRINRDLTGVAVNSPDDIEALVASIKG
jgi:[acyl-carrier-protein] S-malonyltransferase